MKKTVTFSEKRWENLKESLLALAQGNLSKKIIIHHLDDDLESLEILLNLIVEEWNHRVLQMTFNKPAQANKFINLYHIFLNPQLRIIDCDHEFPEFMNLDFNILIQKKITDLLDPESQSHFLTHVKTLDNSMSFYPDSPSISLLGIPFLYSIKKIKSEKIYIINLFQIQLHNKHFMKSYSTQTVERIKLEQKKRYRDIVQEIKQHIDQLPHSELIQLRQLCKKFGINIFQLKKGFQELYQCSAYDYFLTLRMKHAYLLIETSTISLKEIAQMVGYAQYSTFSAQFYKTFQMRPRELRKKGND